jgi:hypothetical protein
MDSAPTSGAAHGRSSGSSTLSLCVSISHLQDFKLLSQKANAERRSLIAEWERWAHGDGARPAEVREETKAWAGSEPELEGLDTQVERYLSVAATLLSDVRFGGAVTGALVQVIEALADSSDATRNAALHELAELEPADRQTVVQGLSEQLTRLAEPEPVIESLAAIGQTDPELTDMVTRVLSQQAVIGRLQAHHVPYLVGLTGVLNAIVAAEGLDADVVAAAREELTGPPR